MPTPLPTIPNTWQVAQHLTQPGALHQFVNVFTVSTTGTDHTIADVAEKVAGAYAAELLPIIGSSVALGDTYVTPLDGSSGAVIVSTTHKGATGGHIGGNDMPDALAYCISWRTLGRGRSHRGRTFLPGVRTDRVTSQADSPLTTAAITDLQTAGDGFLVALADVATAPVLLLEVLSRKLGSTSTVVATKANPHACLQRRRYEKTAHR